MEQQTPSTDGTVEGSPDFIRPNIDAVTEENWPAMQANGIMVLDSCVSDDNLDAYLKFSQSMWGVANVLTGDPFDDVEQRPLRLKPGRGIYARPDGLEHYRMMKDRFRRANIELDTQGPGPASN